MRCLICCLIAVAIATAGCEAAPPSDRIASRQNATRIEEDFRRHAVEALLAPVLDSADPRHFTRIDPRGPCGAGTQVRVDRRPLGTGAAVPAAPFTVQWMMVECAPFGGGFPRYSGNVKLTVFPGPAGYSVRVEPLGLRIATADGAIRTWAPFATVARPDKLFSAVP